MKQSRAIRRDLAIAAMLVGAHIALTQILSQLRIMEHLLAPGSKSLVALALTALFLALRLTAIVLLPGWLAARLVWHALKR